MYAERKKWDLTDVIIHLNHEKKIPDTKQDEESKGLKVDHIEKTIQLFGDLNENQKQRLMEIADRCPVHRSLHAELIINSELAAV